MSGLGAFSIPRSYELCWQIFVPLSPNRGGGGFDHSPKDFLPRLPMTYIASGQAKDSVPCLRIRATVSESLSIGRQYNLP